MEEHQIEIIRRRIEIIKALLEQAKETAKQYESKEPTNAGKILANHNVRELKHELFKLQTAVGDTHKQWRLGGDGMHGRPPMPQPFVSNPKRPTRKGIHSKRSILGTGLFWPSDITIAFQ